jgi:hypothetical protein
MDKLNYIIKEIESLKPFNIYVKKAIKERKEFYISLSDKLEVVQIENIKKYNFKAEVLTRAEALEKQKYISKFLDIIVKLEVHAYAPEMNILHFKKHYIRVPQAKTIAEAIAQIINNNSLNSLKNEYLQLK